MSQSEIDAKIQAVDSMLKAVEWLTRAQMLLRWQQKNAEADWIKAEHDELRAEIERLVGRVADAWTVDLPTIRAAIEKASLDVSARVNDIQNKIDVAQSVVKIVGQAEGAISAIKAIVHA